MNQGKRITDTAYTNDADEMDFAAFCIPDHIGVVHMLVYLLLR